MAIEEKLMTAAELLALPDDGMRYELIRGVLCKIFSLTDSLFEESRKAMRPPGLALCRESQLSLDVSRESVVDFNVSWDRLPLAGHRVDVDIVPGAMPQECAALVGELPDQRGSLHTLMSLVWYPAGTSSSSISW